jgi:hypothetical protein
VLLNTWKHHAAAIRQRILAVARAGESALRYLPSQLLVVGTELMDLYTGVLTPSVIAERIIAELEANQRRERGAYDSWLLSCAGGYSVVTFPQDDSRWVLRKGDEAGHYVHVHPARWAVHTRRVRANVLKTAIMVQAHVAVHGGDSFDVGRINAVRKEFLGLSPIGKLSGDEGLALILKELGQECAICLQ